MPIGREAERRDAPRWQRPGPQEKLTAGAQTQSPGTRAAWANQLTELPRPSEQNLHREGTAGRAGRKDTTNHRFELLEGE